MLKTPIEWCDYSWPIVNGCRRISPGCGGPDGGGCYAERLAATRLRHLPKYEGLATMTTSGPRWTGNSRLWLPDLADPLRLKKPSRIFVADMGDLFYEEVTNEEIDQVFAVMSIASHHVFQVLTKRAKRMREYMTDPGTPFRVARAVDRIEVRREVATLSEETRPVEAIEWPLPGLHLGVSVESQKYAAERVPHLLQTPAAVRWVSAEPLLEAVDFSTYLGVNDDQRRAGVSCVTGYHPGLNWIVVGGESGPGARPFYLSWARSIVAQCRAAGVPVFCKQMGSYPVGLPSDLVPPVQWTIPGPGRLGYRDRKGGDPEEWPMDLRCRQFPATAPAGVRP